MLTTLVFKAQPHRTRSVAAEQFLRGRRHTVLFYFFRIVDRRDKSRSARLGL